MENLFIYVIATVSVLAMVYAFGKVAKDAKDSIIERKNIHKYTNSYLEIFKKNGKEKNEQKGLFEFNTLQSRKALLKKNTGKNLCTDCEKFEYVEYFPTIKY